MVRIGTPAAAMRVPKVWRSSWKVTVLTSARLTAWAKRRTSFERSSGLPVSGGGEDEIGRAGEERQRTQFAQ